jgi:hypothetical protein
MFGRRLGKRNAEPLNSAIFSLRIDDVEDCGKRGSRGENGEIEILADPKTGILWFSKLE